MSLHTEESTIKTEFCGIVNNDVEDIFQTGCAVALKVRYMSDKSVKLYHLGRPRRKYQFIRYISRNNMRITTDFYIIRWMFGQQRGKNILQATFIIQIFRKRMTKYHCFEIKKMIKILSHP